jgi:DNA-binding IclR family transcriptional regulator
MALLELRYSTISAVSRAVQVLELLSETSGLSVTDLALAARAGKPMISRVLTTLAEAGYVRKEPGSDRYALSLKILSLGHRYSERRGFPDVALPVLQQLAQETGELVQLAVVEGDRMRFVAKAEGDQRIRMLSMLGHEVPLHASSIGKAWLASIPDERVRELMARHGMPRLTSRTLTRVEDLLAELRVTAERGYATVREEILEGAAGAGVTIAVGNPPVVVGGISIVGPIFRMPPERVSQLPALLKSASEELAAIWPREMVWIARGEAR